MDEQLKIYNFYNGYVHRNASLCNIYQVLHALKIASWPKHNGVPCDAMGWVRDYTEGHTIKTQTQLDTLILNDPCRLRISFFTPDVYSINDLKLIAELAQFPAINGNGKLELPTGMDVYTLWFCNENPCITKSGITDIDTLFIDMATAYSFYPSFDSLSNSSLDSSAKLPVTETIKIGNKLEKMLIEKRKL